jgi:DNA-binding response OmpR family regulator
MAVDTMIPDLQRQAPSTCPFAVGGNSMAAPNDVVSRNDLWFAVLGPLHVERGGSPLALGGPKPRTLLAALLLQPDRLVPTDTLVEALWGEHPPPTAIKTVQKYLSTLRQQLGEVLATGSGGYLR